ncbi:glycosyltransferase family 4 protein [Streptomyces aidingensis]|uniref:glycosyltransferase family 4 protein n=1 Tax=Streptomyces aidingensis TaxID=910347 RepID=UPI0011148529|nr:glycosyltransferase family 4 protein [Streptomyces aidingensis]
MDEIVQEIDRVRPVWLRVANFFGRTLEVLRRLNGPRLVVWKLEFWGTDTPYDQVPASAGVDPAAYAEELFGLGHHVVPYTFNEWGRDRLSALVPGLKRRPVGLLPIAQKEALGGDGRDALRRRLGIPVEAVLYGCGGLLHPAKGIEEVVGRFLNGLPGEEAHLLCALVVEDEEDTEDVIRRRWEGRFGRAGMDRVHLRTGLYGDWEWMCAFYRAIDVMLVNSLSDSWGRMVSEPLGFHVPTLVRRADCGTNHIAPGVVLVDDFAGLSASEFAAAVRGARTRAPRLAAYVAEHYGLPVVRQRWVEFLRARTPPERRAAFEQGASDPGALAALDDLVVH